MAGWPRAEGQSVRRRVRQDQRLRPMPAAGCAWPWHQAPARSRVLEKWADDRASLVDAVVHAIDAHYGRVLAVRTDAEDHEQTLPVFAEEVGLGHPKAVGGVNALDQL